MTGYGQRPVVFVGGHLDHLRPQRCQKSPKAATVSSRESGCGVSTVTRPTNKSRLACSPRVCRCPPADGRRRKHISWASGTGSAGLATRRSAMSTLVLPASERIGPGLAGHSRRLNRARNIVDRRRDDHQIGLGHASGQIERHFRDRARASAACKLASLRPIPTTRRATPRRGAARPIEAPIKPGPTMASVSQAAFEACSWNFGAWSTIVRRRRFCPAQARVGVPADCSKNAAFRQSPGRREHGPARLAGRILRDIGPSAEARRQTSTSSSTAIAPSKVRPCLSSSNRSSAPRSTPSR